MQNRKCNLCGSINTKIILESTDRFFHFKDKFYIHKCVDCGLLYTVPQLKGEELEKHYPMSYPPYLPKKINQKRNKILEFVKKSVNDRQYYFPPRANIGKVLEIGCSTGLFLKELEGRGFDVMGVEFNKEAVLYATSKLNLSVQRGDFLLTDVPDIHFDFVIGLMVLEHFSNPMEALKKIHQSLKKEGLFIFNIPNTGSIERKIFKERWFAYEIPRHLYHFNVNTIKSYLTKTGFSLDKIYYQKVPNNLIWSLRYVFEDKIKTKTLRNILLNFLRIENKAALLLFYPISILLSFFKTSGRILIHAKKR